MSNNTTNKPKFNFKTKWVSTSGWRGYSEPLYAVCGANNTGMFDDSPCPTAVCEKEIKEAAKALGGIPYRLKSLETSNVFCQSVYVIVPPDRIEEARAKFAEYFKEAKATTRLLYAV